jgi:hypothetical protein
MRMRFTTKLERLERECARRFPMPEPQMDVELTDEERDRRIRALWEYHGTDPDTLMRQRQMWDLFRRVRERQQTALAAKSADAGQNT